MPPKSKSTGLETLEHGVLLKFAEELQAKNDTLVSALKACVGMLFGAANVLQANGLSIEQSGLLETAEMLLEQVKKGKAKPKSVKRPAAGAKQAPRKTAKGKPQGGAANGSNTTADDEDEEEVDEEEEEEEELKNNRGNQGPVGPKNKFDALAPKGLDQEKIEYTLLPLAESEEAREMWNKAQFDALRELHGQNVAWQMLTDKSEPQILQLVEQKLKALCTAEKKKIHNEYITPRSIKRLINEYNANAAEAEGEQKSV